MQICESVIHKYKFFKKRVGTRKRIFCARVVDIWNRLDEMAIIVETINGSGRTGLSNVRMIMVVFTQVNNS